MSRMIDMHSHVAWGIDDGMPNKMDAMEAISQAQQDGIVAICSTPHFIPGQLDQSVYDEIVSRQKELKEMSSLPIYLGGEVMMNSEFIQYLDDGLYPCINGTKYMLVEYNVLKDIHRISYHEDTLYECSVRGYKPVIAHIERYFHHELDWDIIENWQNEGYVLQINRTSLMGMSGSQVQDNAWELLEKGVGHLICTDTHRSSGRRVECLSDAYQEVEGRLGKENADLLFYSNPQAILEGRPVEDLTVVQKKKKKRFGFFRR